LLLPGAGLLPLAGGGPAAAAGLCRAAAGRPGSQPVAELLVLLRWIKNLLPLREGVSGRLAARLPDSARMKKALAVVPLAALLAACATAPTGPSVMVLPGTGKSFDQFRFDDNECRQFAMASLGGKDADQAMQDSGVKSAAVGAAVGALA